MSAVRYAHVDAFAKRPFAGNPAGVVELAAWPEDGLLQRIATELALPETAFVGPDGAGGLLICWFSPRREVAMCGHATLAAAHALMGERREIAFATRTAGVLTITREGARYALSLPALPPVPRPLPEVAAAVGGAPVETLWHAGGYAALVYPDEAAVRALVPDFARLAALGNLLAIATAQGTGGDVVTRAFAPAAGVDEDAVTGSAHAVVAPWWAARLGRTTLAARQLSARGGAMLCRVEGARVVLVGACATVLTGMLRLDLP